MDPSWVFVGAVFVGLAALMVVKVAGPSLSEPTELDDDGVVCVRNDVLELVQADPEALARGRGVADPNAYALARVIRSEVGGAPLIAQIGVAWTVLNHARDVGRSVLAVVTRATNKAGDAVGDGFFGTQGGSGGTRYVSSSQDPTDDDLAIAAGAIAGDPADPTGGAVNFDSPASYGVQAGTAAAGADDFAQNRQAEGKELVTLPGVSASTIRFWRPA